MSETRKIRWILQRASIWLTVVALPLSTSASGTDGSGDLDVAQIVARHVEALGGTDAMAAVGSLKLTGTYSFNGVDRPMTVIQQRPDRYRFELELEDGGRVINACDGQTAWSVSGRSPEPAAMATDDARRFMEEVADFDGPLVEYQDKGHRVELVGTENIDGVDTYHLRVTLQSGGVQDWYLSQEDFLPVRKVTVQVHRRAGEYQRVWYLMEYQETAGVKRPHYIEREDRQHVRAYAIDRVEAEVEVNPAIFALPAGSPKARPGSGSR